MNVEELRRYSALKMLGWTFHKSQVAQLDDEPQEVTAHYRHEEDGAAVKVKEEDWRPDEKLDQLGLVLKVYKRWYQDNADWSSPWPHWSQMEHDAWDDPTEALRAMCEAHEGHSSKT